MFDIRRLVKLCHLYFLKAATAVCKECGTPNEYLDPNPNHVCRLCKERAKMFSGEELVNKKQEERDTVPAITQSSLIYEGEYGMEVYFNIPIPLPGSGKYSIYFQPIYIDTTPSGDPNKIKWKLGNHSAHWAIVKDGVNKFYYSGKRQENKNDFDDMFYNMTGLTSDDFTHASSDEFKKDLMSFIRYHLNPKDYQGVDESNIGKHFDWIIDNGHIKLYKL